MANKEHIRVVMEGAAMIATWRSENPGTALDLAGSNIDGAGLSNADLSGSNLTNASLNNADLSGANLRKASLRNTKIEGAVLEGADFRRCNLTGSRVRDANFRGAKHLFGPDRAILEGVQDAEFVTYSFRFDLIPWSHLRSISTLRIFGASYGAFIAITVYVLFSKYWNAKLVGVHDWATKRKWDVSIEFWTGLVSRIPPLPVPNRLGWQLLMIGVLAVGATLYAFFCPDIVRETTESRWTRELKEPVIEYRSAMYSGILLRHACAVCYLSGGLYTMWYIFRLGCDAIRYLMS